VIKVVITINNWGPKPSHILQVGQVELAVMVPEDDLVWEESNVQVLLCHCKNDPARIKELQEQLQFGEQLTAEEQEQSGEMKVSQSDVFALSDEELEDDNT